METTVSIDKPTVESGFPGLAARARPEWDCVAADLAIQAPSITADTLCPHAFGLLDVNSTWPSLCICDEEGGVLGLLSRRVCMSVLSKPLMLDLYSRRAVRLIMHATPLVVDVGESIDFILERIAEGHPDALTDGFVLTRDGRYAGVATPQLLMMRSVEQSRRRAQVLDNAHKQTVMALEQVGALLNNSGQGFLSFAPDLIVEDSFSNACISMLGKSPAGRMIDELLFPDDPRSRKLLQECTNDAFGSESALQRDMYLSLIPAEIRVGDKVLEVQFIPIDTGIMVILSDITDEKTLARQLDRENHRMEMIVAAVTDAGDFFAAVDEFRLFIEQGESVWATCDVALLYREIHTFKGTFNQFGFYHVPAALHQVESKLSDHDEDDGQDASAMVFAVDWCGLLDRDLATLTEALGPNFIERRGVVTLTPEQAKRFEGYALDRLKHDDLAEDQRRIMLDLSMICTVSLHEELKEFNRLIEQVAARLEKEVAPLVVEGDDIRIDFDVFGSFLRNLGHLFRNAVDHGIEDPDTRVSVGKDEFGTVTCRTSCRDSTLLLEISDDGRGIDETALRRRALEKIGPDTAQWSVEDLIFADGLSSRDVATELSGRGVGLAALRAAVFDLKGAVQVVSRSGQGTSFMFSFPLANVGRMSP